ncbi:MAG: glycoside hydrolase family 9 protein [Bacteroidales bacterium]|nr:glycoside hydrolase family 9 protein [Candidatus Liminaster caballi]
MKSNLTIALAAALLTACTPGKKEIVTTDANCADVIKVNQVGYYPSQEKVAVIEADAFADSYSLVNAQTGETVWTGSAVRETTSEMSGKVRQIVDFSSVKETGSYVLKAGNYAMNVEISEHPLRKVAVGAMKAFYLNRSGVEILAEYAGEEYARPAAHLDTEVLIHPSAASKQRPEGTVISSPFGWYDAGDFNKYIVNSGFSTGLMLMAYQMRPEHFASYSYNIPESGNATPDYLDEIYFNLKWMLTMQDPNDGGVYHKLTVPSFEGFEMPADCHKQRYVVQKTTAATLDFAAAMAQASRIYGQYEEYAEFSKTALEAAKKAWLWARKNPSIAYRQNEMNEKFDPDVTTGAYDDESFGDEFFWASSELYFATGKRQYLNFAEGFVPKGDYTLPSWGNVNGLAIMAWLIEGTYGFSPETDLLAQRLQYKLINYCDACLESVPSSCFQSPYGNTPSDFGWGCLSEMCCSRALSMLFAYRLTSEDKYLKGALQCADYLFGRNATGYCYVTGFGTKSPMHPHQRISEADGVEAPLPGFLVGGPNPGQQDRATCPEYPSNVPDESYNDHMASYASNEIAINWNAALAAMVSWLDAEIK